MSEDNRLHLDWDRLHPQSREELASGVARPEYVRNRPWADIPGWLQDDIRLACEVRTYGKVTLS